MLVFTLVTKLRTWPRRICAGNGAERHRLPQAARRVAVAKASHLSFVVRGGTAWSQCGGAYQVKARAGNESSMKMEAYDADGVKLAGGQSPNGGAVGKIDKISIAKDGWVFLKVSVGFQFNVPELTYSLALGEGDVASPPRPKAAPQKSPPHFGAGASLFRIILDMASPRPDVPPRR